MDDNVHKDFHGAMSYGLIFLEEQYGLDGMREYLARAGEAMYRDLIADLKARGLPALEEHWRRIFTQEDGEFDLRMEGDTLVLDVKKCPAIHHMKEHNYRIAPHFCEHTRVVNDAICRAAGYEATVEYDQDAGRCVQRFRRAQS